MLTRLRSLPWTPMVLTAVLGLMMIRIVKAVQAPPTTATRPSDSVTAMREVAGQPGTVDVRSIPPTGNLVSGNGRVEPFGQEVDVAGAVAGVVQSVRVQEGDQVAAGDVLVELGAAVERAALSAAEADLTGQRAALSKAVAGVRSEDRTAASAELAAARSRASLAVAEAARTAQLARSGAATDEELEKARQSADEATATARASEARSLAADRGSRGEDVQQLRAQVAGAEARVAQARAVLDRLVIRAPAPGEVLDVKVLPGEYWQPAAGPVVIVGDTRRLRVRMEVDERDIERVKVGSAAFVTAEPFGDRRFTGRVGVIGRRMGRKSINSTDPAERKDTQVLELLIDLDAPAGLVSGLRVTSYVEPVPTMERG